MSTIPLVVFDQASTQAPFVSPPTGFPLFSGAWSSSTQYGTYSTVTFSGSVYASLQPNINVTPGTNGAVWALAIPASGGVSSVTLTAPAIFSVTGSPVTSTGTLAIALATQSAAAVFAGPATGSAAAPTFRALAGSDLPFITVNAQTGTTYTVAATDKAALITLNNAASVAVAVPQATGSFASGFYCEVENIGAGTVTLTPTTSTIDGAASLTLKQFQSVTLVSNGTNWLCLRSKPIIVATAAVSHQFVTAIAADGTGTLAQPAFTDISGTVAAAQLPNPSASTLGGVQSKAAATSNWINAISTSGVPSATQPASTDLSDVATLATLTGSQALTNKTLGGAGATTPSTVFNRLAATRGTALTTAKVGTLTGWGTTASVLSVGGTDSGGFINIQSAGTGQTGNPTFILTFADGTWTNAPTVIVCRGDGNTPSAAAFTFATSATTVTIGLQGTPVAGVAYTLYFITIGR